MVQPLGEPPFVRPAALGPATVAPVRACEHSAIPQDEDHLGAVRAAVRVTSSVVRVVVAVSALVVMWLSYTEFTGPRGSACQLKDSDKIDLMATYAFVAATVALVLAVLRRPGLGCIGLVAAVICTVIAVGTGIGCLR